MKKNYFVFLALCSILFFNITVCGNISLLCSSDSKTLDSNDGFRYITIQHESDPTKLPLNTYTLEQFQSIYTLLTTSKLYSYYEIYTQQLYDSHDTRIEIPSVQISQNVQNDFGLCVTNGRLLNSEDFILEADIIPVLVGKDYIGTLHLGELFCAEYLFYNYTFEVIGFLNEESYINYSSNSIFLDDKIVMPSFSIYSSPQTGEEALSNIIHYSNKTSGKLKLLPTDYGQVDVQISSVLANEDVGQYSWYTDSSIINYENSGIDLLMIYNISLAILILTTVVLIVVTKHWLKRMRIDGCCFTYIQLLVRLIAGLSSAHVVAAAAMWWISQGDWVSWNIRLIHKNSIYASIGLILIFLIVKVLFSPQNITLLKNKPKC